MRLTWPLPAPGGPDGRRAGDGAHRQGPAV